MKIIWPLLLLLAPMSSFAQAKPCPELVERRGSIQVQQIGSSDDTICYISIHNFKQGGLLYRDYLVSSESNFMVFNSYGEGPDSSSTGAREFFFFPRTQPSASFAWNDETRRLEVTDVTGGKLFFDYEDAEIIDMSKGAVKIASEVSKSNKGGVEISKYQGLKLDVGFTIGKAPSQVSGATSTFTDQSGLSCKVKNTDIFKYLSSGDVKFKLTDKALMSLLKTKCPTLTLPTL